MFLSYPPSTFFLGLSLSLIIGLYVYFHTILCDYSYFLSSSVFLHFIQQTRTPHAVPRLKFSVLKQVFPSFSVTNLKNRREYAKITRQTCKKGFTSVKRWKNMGKHWKRLFWPANSVQSTRLLVEIHNNNMYVNVFLFFFLSQFVYLSTNSEKFVPTMSKLIYLNVSLRLTIIVCTKQLCYFLSEGARWLSGLELYFLLLRFKSWHPKKISMRLDLAYPNWQ